MYWKFKCLIHILVGGWYFGYPYCNSIDSNCSNNDMDSFLYFQEPRIFVHTVEGIWLYLYLIVTENWLSSLISVRHYLMCIMRGEHFSADNNTEATRGWYPCRFQLVKHSKLLFCCYWVWNIIPSTDLISTRSSIR